jgi:hypothetical protein
MARLVAAVAVVLLLTCAAVLADVQEDVAMDEVQAAAPQETAKTGAADVADDKNR